MKKLITLAISSIFLVTACNNKQSIEKEYLALTHEANKIYIDFSTKSSEVMKNALQNSDNKTFDYKNTINDLNKIKDDYIKKLDAVGKDFKNKLSKESIEAKKSLVLFVSDHTISTLQKFDNTTNKTKDTLVTIIKENVNKSKDEAQKILDKDHEILKELDDLVNKK